MTRTDKERLDTYTAGAKPQDVERIRSNLDSMNRGPVTKLWNDVRALWTMVGDPSAAWTSKAIAVGALLYLISPLDAIPDVLPIVGLSDDAGVILAAVASLCNELARYQPRGERRPPSSGGV